MTPLVDDGGARHLQAGLSLPDLALASTAGGSVSLRQLPGRSVVFIYPWTGRPGYADPQGWDDIPGAHGSTPQAAAFRDSYDAFLDADVEVFGLSAQDTVYQSEFVQRMGLPFAMLSDVELVLQHALQLPTFTIGDTVYFKRLTLILNAGVIRHCLYPIRDPSGNAAEVLAVVQAT